MKNQKKKKKISQEKKTTPTYLLSEQQPSDNSNKDSKRDFRDVCILLIFRDKRVMLEPSFSERLGIKIMKPLSLKFDKMKNGAAEGLSMLISKYELSGLYDQMKKIDFVENFETGGKIFHVFSVTSNRGSIHAKGAFGFVDNDRIVTKESLEVKGTGDCLIPKSLRKALDATLAVA